MLFFSFLSFWKVIFQGISSLVMHLSTGGGGSAHSSPAFFRPARFFVYLLYGRGTGTTVFNFPKGGADNLPDREEISPIDCFYDPSRLFSRRDCVGCSLCGSRVQVPYSTAQFYAEMRWNMHNYAAAKSLSHHELCCRGHHIVYP